MACFKNGTIIDLGARESVSLPNVRGTTLRVTRGSVWITQENDTHDIVLRAGDSWTVDKNGLTILEAQENTTFYALGQRLGAWVMPQPATGPARSTFGARVRDALAAFFMGPPRSTVPYA